MIQKTKTYILGDTHGDYPDCYSYKDSTIFHVGDFGIGFYNNLDNLLTNILDEELTNNNSKLLIIMGNHDSPIWWKDKSLSKNLKNIYFVDTGEIIKHEKDYYLFLGGAISIDRQFRKDGIDYWKDEGFEGFEYVYNKIKDNPLLSKVTKVISHTAPTFCPPVDFNAFVESFFKNDPKLKEELLNERKELNKTFDYLKLNCPKLKNWYFGHFHPNHSWTQVFYDINFTCLKINHPLKIINLK